MVRLTVKKRIENGNVKGDFSKKVSFHSRQWILEATLSILY
jgi:hypothetical protein